MWWIYCAKGYVRIAMSARRLMLALFEVPVAAIISVMHV